MSANPLQFVLRHKILAGVIIGFAFASIASRIYLPFWLRDYINAEISQLENYSGSVESVGVSLWRGAYQIHGMDISKTTGGIDKPFLSTSSIDLALDWGSLIRGRVVAEVDIYDIKLNFAKNQTGQGAGWPAFVDVISPLDVNRLTVHGGRIAYIDYTAEPTINLYIEDIVLSITNLRNVRDGENRLPSRVDAYGTSVGGGDLRMGGNMNFLKDTPDFDFGLELRGADLTAFNDYAREYALLDFSKGTVGIFAELAAADGHVVGYVKPVATDIALIDLDQDQNPFNILWEAVASLFIELFENQPQDQFAARVPIEGDLGDPDQDMWAAFFSIFKNAFGKAFSKDEDGTVNFNDAYREASKEAQSAPREKQNGSPNNTDEEGKADDTSA